MSNIYVIIEDDRNYEDGSETVVGYKLTEDEAISFCKESNKKLLEYSKIPCLFFGHFQKQYFDVLEKFAKENSISFCRNDAYIYFENISVEDDLYEKLKKETNKTFVPSKHLLLELMGYNEYSCFRYEEIKPEGRLSI